VWSSYTVEAATELHNRQMDEIFEEVTRARAQVADLIGKE
jgi:hypothetical protein